MTTRELAIEQVRNLKGPNSSFAGRGSAGGAVNAVTKQATLDYDFTRISAGVGTDKAPPPDDGRQQRVSATASPTRQRADLGEDVPTARRRAAAAAGLALSGLWGAEQRPVGHAGLLRPARQGQTPGSGWLPGGHHVNRRPASGVPVYAQSNDFVNSDVDTVTARIAYRFAPTSS